MCGIAGRIDPQGSGLPAAVEARVFAALAHRGPDAHRRWFSAGATLLHTRLRILDLSERADQPMALSRGREAVVVYNGEIYNFQELREALRRKGWTFHTTSDTEVFLAGYLTWGNEVFRRARGMWAVAIWEPAPRRLTLARDPMGKKPLFWAGSSDRLCFGSNLLALLPLMDHTPEPDPAALDCFLAHLCVPWEHTAFRGVAKVPPGGVLTWTPGRPPEVSRYWSIPTTPDLSPSFDEAVSGVERLLRQAVRRRLESDVPLGVFLSAGYDSGLVAALAAQESGTGLVAVTAGTEGSGYDEREAAALVAARYGMRYRPLEVPALSAASLPLLLAELGEPFGDPSILPSYEVARAARREITVALTGDGGDEGFFGYATFRGVALAERYRRMTPAPLRALLYRGSRSRTADDWRRRAAALFEYGHRPLQLGFRNRMGFTPFERGRLLRPSADGHAAEHVYHDRLAGLAGLPDADALRRMFFETYLPNDYLAKVDSATMAASLEARSPFLDVDLVTYALRLPAAVAFPRHRLKALLRPLVQRHLPAELLRRPKTGFGVPVGRWMRQELRGAMEEFVFRPGTTAARYVDPGTARSFFDAHGHGADHSTRLWALLAFGVWCAVMVDRSWDPADPLPVLAGVS
ncbi:MAG: asparagine synthase (glutamine-hydrolyzing) [Gemmatimonadales bacterium]